MRVLHIFSRWLNQTMNWAYHLIDHTDAEHFVISDMHFQHHFTSEKIHVLRSPMQKRIPSGRNEWQLPLTQMMNARWGGRLQQQFIERTLSRMNMDIVHFHFATMAVKYSHVMENWPGPKVVSFYGYDYEKAPHMNPSLRRKYSDIFKWSHRVLVEGDHGKSILSKKGCDTTKIRVLPLGIPLNKTPKRPQKRSGELNLIQPASLVPKKGQIDSLRALKASGLTDNISLTFVGEIGSKKYAKRVKEEAGWAIEKGLVRFKDFVSEKEFQAFLSSYHVMIQPSHYSQQMDCEGGAPVALIHAQWGGLPIISTYHCDIPHVVQEGQTALLSQERDIENLAEAIRRMYHMDSLEFDAMSREAQTWVGANFDCKMSGNKLTEIYKELVQ